MGHARFEKEAEWSRIVGERILLRRDEQGLTQQRLADAVGISRYSLRMYENGDRSPNAHTLYRIGRVLSVDIGYFYGTIRASEHATF